MRLLPEAPSSAGWGQMAQHCDPTFVADPLRVVQHVYRVLRVNKVRDLGARQWAHPEASGGGAFDIGGDFAIAVVLAVGALAGALAAAVGAGARLVRATDERPPILVAEENSPGVGWTPR